MSNDGVWKAGIWCENVSMGPPADRELPRTELWP